MAEAAVLSLHAAAEVVEAEEASYRQEVAEEAASCRHACRILAVEEEEKYRFR